MRYFNICIYIILIVSNFKIGAQVEKGSLVIIEDQKITLLIRKYRKINESIHYFNGYRIQIYSKSGPNSQTLSKRIKRQFEENMPQYKVYIDFESPNFIVTVGNYHEKLHAEKDLNKINKYYPNAFIKKSLIEYVPPP